MRVQRISHASWCLWCGCVLALAGCAGSHTQRPGATPGSEPTVEQPIETAEGVTLTNDPSAGSAEISPSVGEVERATLPEAEADRRDRDMREAVEGPATARGRAADNSAQNERDRTGITITPVEQSHETPDVELAARIRRALIADDALSFDAKNVKVVAESGQVTLRGPVENAAEKARVEKLAREAGNGRVISLLELKQ